MGTKEVIDYVMNSPGNTNKAVLKGLLGDTASGGSGNGVFMVEVGPKEDSSNIMELKASWQEIYDAFKSGKLVVIHDYSIDPSGSGGFGYSNFIADTVTYNPSVSKPYQVHSTMQQFYYCEAPGERPSHSSGGDLL